MKTPKRLSPGWRFPDGRYATHVLLGFALAPGRLAQSQVVVLSAIAGSLGGFGSKVLPGRGVLMHF